jgi:hypothetical protein
VQSFNLVGDTVSAFEVDYPHGDSTWPNTLATVERLVTAAGLSDDEIHAVVRGNAIRCYGLDRYGITH